ncbi:MAG: BrnT family toxin [Gammaproteobacteria bacterium]|nr:BrnT family toxin [Gammaproteobacteria bacterium]
MGFEWDDATDRSNQNKHGLSFSKAARLFQSSQDYLELFDAAHSQAEDRFIAIGEIDRGIVVGVYTEREDDLIRIIGARLATKREQERYREHMDRYI